MALAEKALVKAGENVLLAMCLNWRAQVAMAERNYAVAELLYRRCLEVMEKSEEAERSDVMACRLQLVDPLQRLGRHDEAAEILRQLAEQTEVHSPQEIGVVARAALMLGDVHLRAKRAVEATVALSRAMQLQRENSVLDDPEVAYLHFCLGRVAGSELRHADAERHYTECIALCKKAGIEGGLILGAALLGMGYVRATQCRWGEALDFLQQVTDAASKAGGGEASLQEFGWATFGRVYLELHRYEEAEDYLQRAVDVAVQSKAPEADVQTLRDDLARAQRGKATPLDKRGVQTVDDILDQLRRERGEAALHDQRYGGRLVEQAKEQRKHARWDRTLMCYQAAQRIYESAFGHGHEAIADCLHWQGVTLTVQGRTDAAEHALREALSILSGIQRQGRVPRFEILNALGAVLVAQRRYAEAQQLMEQAVAEAEAQHRPEAKLATLMMNLGIACEYSGHRDAAEDWHLRALALLDRAAKAGQAEADLGRELGNLSSFYMGRGDYRMAETVLKRALDILERIRGKAHPAVVLRGQYECIAARLARSQR